MRDQRCLTPAAEYAEIVRRHRGGLFLLGVALPLVGHVPVLGLLMPVYGGLAFIHYGLGRLGELRSEPIEGASGRVCGGWRGAHYWSLEPLRGTRGAGNLSLGRHHTPVTNIARPAH